MIRDQGHLKEGKVKGCGCFKTRPATSEKAWNNLWSRLTTTAVKRNIIFSLTKEQTRSIVESDCYYCGSKPDQISRADRKNDNAIFLYNGLDRVDSSAGYSIDNVVAACGYCNRSKHTRSAEEFEAWLSRLVNFRSNK